MVDYVDNGLVDKVGLGDTSLADDRSPCTLTDGEEFYTIMGLLIAKRKRSGITEEKYLG